MTRRTIVSSGLSAAPGDKSGKLSLESQKAYLLFLDQVRKSRSICDSTTKYPVPPPIFTALEYYDPSSKITDPAGEQITPSATIFTPKSSPTYGILPLDERGFTALPSIKSDPLPAPSLKMKMESLQPMSGFDINQSPPFQNPVHQLGFQPYGVIKIQNIPYNVTIAEVKHFVTRLTSARLIKDHQQGFGVHIIMDRATGKTLDSFVEFQHQSAAEECAQRAALLSNQGKGVKIGNRHLRVFLSSEGELAAAMFPRAKNCVWDPVTGVPTILENNDPYSEGFQGYCTFEEISNVVKYAENPQKSQFTARCQQRTYETMISILYKFPWSNTKSYTVNSRNSFFRSYLHMLNILIARIPPMTDSSVFHPPGVPITREVGMNHSLLMDFVFAGLNVPCFSMRQKCMIIHSCGPIGAGFGLEVQAAIWPFHGLMPPRSFPSASLDTWLSIINTGYTLLFPGRTSHNVEHFVTLTCDLDGAFMIELTDAGRTLRFDKLVELETRIMHNLVERGRYQWCSDNDTSYAPFNMSKPYSSAIDDENALEAGMQAIELQNKIKPQPTPSRTHAASVAIPTGSRFNPTTPSFVPWQLATGLGHADSQPKAQSQIVSAQSRVPTNSVMTPYSIKTRTPFDGKTQHVPMDFDLTQNAHKPAGSPIYADIRRSSNLTYRTSTAPAYQMSEIWGPVGTCTSYARPDSAPVSAFNDEEVMEGLSRHDHRASSVYRNRTSDQSPITEESDQEGDADTAAGVSRSRTTGGVSLGNGSSEGYFE